MAAALRMMIAFLVFCMPWLAASAASATTPTMRREQGSSFSQIQLSSSGMAVVRAHKSAPTDLNQQADVSEVHDKYVDENVDDGSRGFGDDKDYCNYDFPIGKEGTSDCSDKKFDKMIIDEGDCKQAAAQAGVNVTYDFLVPYSHYMHHPEGCFTTKCEGIKFRKIDPQGICYFFNPSPTTPNGIDVFTSAKVGITGKPVCQRPKIVNGTDNTANDGCPGGYEPIRTEAKCYEFAKCLGYCTGDFMRINLDNSSKYDEYPKYCFLRHDEFDNCAYFNEPREGMWDPFKPVGTPLCNVSEITHFPPMQALEEGSDAK